MKEMIYEILYIIELKIVDKFNIIDTLWKVFFYRSVSVTQIYTTGFLTSVI